MDQVAYKTETTNFENADLVRFLINTGDKDYETRDQAMSLIFLHLDNFLANDNFDGIQELLGMSTTKELPLAYITVLLMATNVFRKECRPSRDLFIEGLLKKYDGYLIEGTTIQAFLVGLV